MFIATSSLLDHLESGHCRSGMTRAKIHELVSTDNQSHHIIGIGARELASSRMQESARYTSTTLASVVTHSTSQLPHTRSTSILASPRQLNLIGEESNPSIDDDTSSERSILDEVPLSPAISESGSESSILGGVLLPLAISESGSEWSFASPIPTPTASNMSDVDLSRLLDITLLDNLRCHRCPCRRKPFYNSVALQAHISLAAHPPKIFRCPLAFVPEASPVNKRKKKEKHFTSLAGLARHLECRACQGGPAAFVNVMNYVHDQLASLGFESVRLLLD